MFALKPLVSRSRCLLPNPGQARLWAVLQVTFFGNLDAAELNLLVEDEIWGGGHGCFAHSHQAGPGPGAKSAPDEINKAFADLSDQGYRFARPARTVYWKKDDRTYWIQWTLKGDAAVLWAYDPIDKKAVEILQVREIQ